METIGRVPVEWLAARGKENVSNGEKRRTYLRAIWRKDILETSPRTSKRRVDAGSDYTRPCLCKRRHGRKG